MTLIILKSLDRRLVILPCLKPPLVSEDLAIRTFSAKVWLLLLSDYFFKYVKNTFISWTPSVISNRIVSMSWTMEYIAPKEKMTATRQIDAPMGTARDILDCFWRTDRGSESELDNGPFIEGVEAKTRQILIGRTIFETVKKRHSSAWRKRCVWIDDEICKNSADGDKAWSLWRYPNRWTLSILHH